MILELKTKNQEVFLTLENKVGEQYALLTWYWKYEYGLESVREGCEAILSYMKSNNLKKYLNNMVQTRDSWDELGEWFVNDWFPRLIQAGVSKIAQLSSEDFYANLVTDSIVDEITAKIPKGLDLKLFDNEETAMKWLREE